MIWPRATKANPCKVCGKPDWCTFGDRAMICRRVESANPHLDRGGNVDGWYHFYEESKPVIPAPKWTPPRPSINPQSIPVKSCGDELAAQLGVSMSALRCLGVGWSDEYNAWMFPMRDGNNEIVGWNRRFKDGTKKIVAGTKAGLYIPQMDVGEPVFICEGGSDTAALLDMGLFGIGRFNVASGANDLKTFFAANKIYRCVIIADNDSIKQLGNQRARPGINGAMRLKKDLNMVSCLWQPPSPCKDVREYMKRGGTGALILNDLKNKVWRKE